MDTTSETSGSQFGFDEDSGLERQRGEVTEQPDRVGSKDK